MHGFNALPPLSRKDTVTLHVTNLVEEIRNRQIKKHGAETSSALVNNATLEFKDALINLLLEPLENASCHLSYEHTLSNIVRITSLQDMTVEG